jgi:hypothetical protein
MHRGAAALNAGRRSADACHMTLSRTPGLHENSRWARDEVVELLSELALAEGDQGARRVAAHIEALCRATASPEARLALVFQLSAALHGTFEVLAQLDPGQHPVELAAAVSGKLEAFEAELAPSAPIAV